MKFAALSLALFWTLSPGGAAIAQQPAAVKPEQIKLTVGDAKKLDAMLAAHKGRVVFVDYWATWCGPCVEFFPHTVELSRKFKDPGLAVIAVSFDAADTPQVVREFLARHGAEFENLISSHDLGPAAFEDFKIDLVPHFRLYDRQGNLRHKWDAKPTDAEQKIKELLAEKQN